MYANAIGEMTIVSRVNPIVESALIFFFAKPYNPKVTAKLSEIQGTTP